MPVLKNYTDGSGQYIHSSIGGSVVTFQLTPEGIQRLAAAGIQAGKKVPLRLLADLAREHLAVPRNLVELRVVLGGICCKSRAFARSGS